MTTKANFSHAPLCQDLPSGCGPNTAIATHRLAELEIFSDCGIASILERHPTAAMEVMTAGCDPIYHNQLRRGLPGDFDGRTWIQMVRRGRLSVRLGDVTRHHASLAEIADQWVSEMPGALAGWNCPDQVADLWIASPYMIGCYGADPFAAVNWQIRGQRQTVYYPRQEPFLSIHAAERLAEQRERQPLNYQAAFDRRGTIVDQRPGDVLALPGKTPYRCLTGSTLSVCLITRHHAELVRGNNTNGMLNDSRDRRRCLALEADDKAIDSPAVEQQSPRVVPRITPPAAPPQSGYCFRVDPNAPDCVGPIGSDEETLLEETAAAVCELQQALSPVQRPESSFTATH